MNRNPEGSQDGQHQRIISVNVGGESYEYNPETETITCTEGSGRKAGTALIKARGILEREERDKRIGKIKTSEQESSYGRMVPEYRETNSRDRGVNLTGGDVRKDLIPPAVEHER